MKIVQWISDNILFVFTIFLLSFIPLYPKLPLLDIRNTWVYIRLEDLIVFVVLAVWGVLLVRKKISLQTPLTMPIFLFWLTGGLATIHGVLIIFPTTADIFPNVAFLSFLRRIEYLSLFFIAYSGMKDRRFLLYVIGILVVTFLVVVGYGFGQKYLGFPAYLTMNEEFAKGEPIRLSALSRVPSTFAGHYDLAAYLVLVLPIFASLIFGFKNWVIRFGLAGVILLGFVLMFMTVSRVSFFVLLIALGLMLFFQKKRFVLFSLPFVIVMGFVVLSLTPALLDRFTSTVKEVDVLVDAKTGEVLGHTQTVPRSYFSDKLVWSRFYQNKEQLDGIIMSAKYDPLPSSPSAVILPTGRIPVTAYMIVPPNAPTGENLPQGTGYINLALSPVTKKLHNFFYEPPPESTATDSAHAYAFQGNFLIKRASAYDLSFTTRFQGEWPNALEAFQRNILFGSGYGSVSLAIDNNYLRILGEVGLLGFIAFTVIFVIVGIYIRKTLPHIDSPVARSFVLGFAAGVVGLALNAVFIDVFEASKVAFVLWLLTGVTLGVLHFYQTRPLNFYKELKDIMTSQYAFMLYLPVLAVIIFSPMLSNYFVGDDFTWFRWIADCGRGACPSVPARIVDFFVSSDGFFYRPGTKIYFLMMYPVFWLNQTVYHFVSLLLHITVTLLVFLLARKMLRSSGLAFLAGILFLILSGYHEAVFWISSTGFLFTACFSLVGLLLFIAWDEKKNPYYLAGSIVSMILGMLFHELGIVTPLLFLLYKLTSYDTFSFKLLKKHAGHLWFFLPVLPYLFLRFIAQSHWFSGDYNYNVLKLPFNVVGNFLGYLMLGIIGPISFPIYNGFRGLARDNILLGVIASAVVVTVIALTYKLLISRIKKDDKRVILFSILFIFISLLPFLGLGNITSRYSYLASAGVVILLVFLLQKIYTYIQGYGRDVALSGLAVVIGVFSLFHIIQVQQIHSDWYEAGKKAERFFIAIDELYRDYWTKQPMKFHFVNVPIRMGEAWVFPVGLKDALWLTFRNPDIEVYTWSNTDDAINAVETFHSRTEKVFIFDESGRVTEDERTKDIVQ